MKGKWYSQILEKLGRKTIIAILVILIFVLLITTAIITAKAMQDNKTKEKNITYTESSRLNYRVSLKENEFFEEEYMEADRQYIASLIEHVESNIKYQLRSSEQNMKHTYKYKIVAETNVEDKNNHNSIYKISEDIVQEKVQEYNSSKRLEINETIKIDYNKYNEIIKRFINVYKLDEITPTLTINMYVYVDGVTKGEGYTSPVASLIIPLTTRTVAIDIESNAVNATEISVYKEIVNKENLYMAILFFVLTIMIIIELVIFINSTKDEKALYKSAVKKILLNYDSYIQKINNVFNIEGYQEIEMQSFEDLLQIRDTLSEPVLMVEKENETDFFIPSKGNVVYIYKLKEEDVIKNKKAKKDKH